MVRQTGRLQAPVDTKDTVHHIPGYAGFVPAIRGDQSDIGATYGTATARVLASRSTEANGNHLFHTHRKTDEEPVPWKPQRTQNPVKK